MQFSELLSKAGVEARERRGDAGVTEVVADSRQCRAGSCFVAVRGANEDAHKYIPSAAAAGCSAVVCEDPTLVPAGVAMAAVESSRIAVGRLAQAIRGWPSRSLVNVGITGTKGKSTTACLIRDILEAAGHRPALLGTITYETGRRIADADQTTPGPVALAGMMAEMVAAGSTHLVMEASSHALDQDRMSGIDFRVGVFTNLSGDHQDYHGTREAYLAAKRRLFEGLGADSFAIINRDDSGNAGEAMASAARGKVIWYGLSPAADLRARIDSIDQNGTRFDLIWRPGGPEERAEHATTPLIGRHNVFNCLAAAGACVALGVDLGVIAAALGRVRAVPGRLERVHVEAPFEVFVDYAHTDDALFNVLSAVRPMTKGRLICVFGCGGDRDRTKRPRMAAVAEKMADRVIVTSDNPRSEEPRAIIDEILKGFSEEGRCRVDVDADRRAAIGRAIDMAAPGDIVVIAGKGHEKYQIVGKQRNHFDDVEEAAAAMRRRRS
ncbi:MAG: UDP-N-acetylmuramoyl-L-alanyl-D-glutamate--2,6-diaminopimelate ligase [Phycisphaerae bacterium]